LLTHEDCQRIARQETHREKHNQSHYEENNNPLDQTTNDKCCHPKSQLLFEIHPPGNINSIAQNKIHFGKPLVPAHTAFFGAESGLCSA
jgi:hypothetical protein